MGRHCAASNRRKSPVVLAALAAPFAVFFAVGADVQPQAGARDAAPVVQDVEPCCLELVAAPIELSSAQTVVQVGMATDTHQVVAASRYRVVDRAPQLLPVGRAPEQGLQVRTILVERSISVVFPEIKNIGGVRPDALRWHPEGLALDVMIPNPSSAQGIALGNEIVAYVLKNANRFGIQDAIWRGTYYTPNGARNSGYGHYDHVHVTTTGGGYPNGSESYYR